jgi:hypothetical protein
MNRRVIGVPTRENRQTDHHRGLNALIVEIIDCGQFKAKSLKERNAVVRANKLCFNCLYKGHFLEDCRIKPQCDICQQKHSTLLHRDKPQQQDSTAKGQREVASNAVSSFKMKTNGQVKVALQVVPIRVLGEGTSLTTYALLDSGSEETFIRKSLADQLKLHVSGLETLAVSTMAGESTMEVGKVSLTIEAVKNPLRKVPVQGVVVETLNINTTRPRDLSKWKHLDGIEIPEVDIDDVTVLIGANVPEVQVHLESRVGRSGR